MLLAIHQSISTEEIPSPHHLEVISVKLSLPSPLVICAAYSPPSHSKDECADLCRYLSSLSDSHKVIILGDFNFPDINWHTLSGSTESSALFCEFVFDNLLDQLITEPTHRQGNTLDIILTNCPSIVCDVKVLINNPIPSDHFVISFCLQATVLPTSRSNPRFVYNYRQADFNRLVDYILDCNFQPCLSSDDLEFVWSFIKSTIYEAMDLFIPKVKIKSCKSPKWFNGTIRHKLNCIHHLRRKAKRNTSSSTLKRLKQAEIDLNDAMLETKSKYELNLIKEFAFSKNHKIYEYIKSLRQENSLPSLMSDGSTTVSEDYEKANLFNKYFFSVFTSSSYILPPIEECDIPTSALINIDISDTEVYHVLASLDPSKSSGADGIGPNILKSGALALYVPLHHLFNLCLTQGSMPSEWKIHQITPIFKAGDRSCVNNYRPVSLLCCVSKVLERLIFDKIVQFVTQQISPSQFGFLRHHSSLQQLLIFLSKIISSLESKQAFDVIYMDFKKAFDSVPHRELLHKLRSVGILGSLWKWFESYLTSRFQCVAINGSLSDLLPVVSGVPQGSILGPLLFIIYINDLPSMVHYSSVLLFADDTKCAKSIASQTDCQLLQNDLDSLSSWSLKWNLPFNEIKFRLLQFSSNTNNEPHSYYINGQVISPSTSHKDLGVLFNNSLSWEDHHSLIVSRAYKQLNLLKRTFTFHHVSARKNLYLSLVRSQLSYCSLVWRPCQIKHIEILERVQRRATKFILNYAKLDYKSRLLQLHLFPLMFWFELADILFLVKSFKCPSTRLKISEYISFSSTKTRSSSFLKLSCHSTKSNLSRHFYFNRVCRLWNALPQIDLSLSFQSVKVKIEEFLWSMFIQRFNPNVPCTFHFVCPCTKCMSVPMPTNYHVC